MLLGPSLQHLSFPEVVGAFFTTGVLVMGLGMTGVVRRAMAAIALPMVIVFVLLTAVPALGKRMPRCWGPC